MTEDEWRNTFMQHREILEGFAKKVFQYVPGITGMVEAEEVFDRFRKALKI